MRPHSDLLLDVIRGSHHRRLIVDVFHGSDRVAQDLPVTRWQLDSDLGAEVKQSGSGTVVYASQSGESLVPKGAEGVLSPFRAKLLLLMEITAGEFNETVPLGFVRVTNIPNAYDSFADTDAGRVVTGSVVEFDFESMDVDIRRRGFRSPEQPKVLDSAYQELRRISGMTVVTSLPDRQLPTAFTYEANEGGRLAGVQAIADVLGGVAVVDPAGSLALIPNVQGAPVGALRIGPTGTVVDVAYAVDTEGVYNTVVGSFEDDERNPIYAVAQVTDGPLAVDGLFGENTRYYSSPLVKTQTAANAAVEAILAQSVSGQMYDVPVQCITDPLIELGDVVSVEGHDQPIVGQVVKTSISDSPMMTVLLRVRREL